eukprot:355464-Chlamydomonas_euryale.AAC.1
MAYHNPGSKSLMLPPLPPHKDRTVVVPDAQVVCGAAKQLHARVRPFFGQQRPQHLECLAVPLPLGVARRQLHS